MSPSRLCLANVLCYNALPGYKSELSLFPLHFFISDAYVVIHKNDVCIFKYIKTIYNSELPIA